MALATSTHYQDWLEKWLTHLDTKPAASFFTSGTQNIREMEVQFNALGDVAKFTNWLLGQAQEECSNGGNLLKQNSALFDIMGE